MQESSPASEYSTEPESATPDAARQLRRETARRMGQASTEAKRIAARQNGRRGGRPEGYVVSAETRQKISRTKRAKKRE